MKVVETKTTTLVASTVATVTLNSNSRRIEVVSLNGLDAVWFTLDGTTPVAAANNNHVLPATICSQFMDIDPAASGGTVIKLLSSSEVQVHIRAFN